MWNDEITLIGFKITGKDKLKQDLTEKVKTTIFCKKKSITRSEFYQANQAGIHSFEYDNQEFAEFGGKEYRILKTYPINLNILELTLVEKIT